MSDPQNSQSTLKKDFMASLVVFLVALPLCMGIAIASGVPVAAGLITGIVGGLVVGFISGCPLQVSGPAAGLTVIIIEIVQKFGLEMLGIIVLLAGFIQLSAGILKLGQWFRAVSPAVIKGMLAGIGVLIFASQFHVMVDDKPKHSGIENLITIPNAIAKAASFPDFRSKESRTFHKKVLQQVGDLHLQQVNLEEEIAKIFPHVHDPDVEFTESLKEKAAEKLPGFIEKQESINARLDELLAELRTTEASFSSADRTEKILQACVQTRTKSIEALAKLKGNESESIIFAQDAISSELLALQGQLKNHHLAAHLGVLAILCIIGWQFLPSGFKLIPGPLVAVIVPTIVAAFLILPVIYVEIPDRIWDGVNFPSLTVLGEANFASILQAAIMIAIVASAETLLCATAVDQMHSGTRTNYDKELFAQGCGNMVCGTLGVLPMTGVIVRSSANIQAGGQTRLSAILHGFWLLLFVIALGFVLRQIPTACLAAILVYTGFKLVDFKSIKKLAKYGKSEVAIYFATVATIVCTDLLIGVSVGIGLAALKLLHTFSHLETDYQFNADSNKATLKLTGAATFLRLPIVASELERVPRGAELHIDLQSLDYVDHACLELIMNWASQHESTGGKLVIDWATLNARFSTGNGKSNGAAKRGETAKLQTSSQEADEAKVQDEASANLKA